MLAHFWGPRKKKTPLKCLRIFGDPARKNTPQRINFKEVGH